jgi:integrase/recombinase XerC
MPFFHRKETAGRWANLNDLAGLWIGWLRCVRIAVKGKGQGGESEWLTVAEPTLAALRQWLAMRVSEVPAVFTSFDRHSMGQRLTDNGLYRVLGALAKGAKVARWNPHGLRHTSVTLALELTGGDLRAAQRFARHADPKVTVLYDDDRQDLAGDVARRVAAAI